MTLDSIARKMEVTDMNEKKNNNTSLIRIIMCVISLIIVIISWLDIIPDTIGIIASAGILSLVTAWNGFESLKENNKHTAVIKFVTTAVLLIICAVALIF